MTDQQPDPGTVAPSNDIPASTIRQMREQYGEAYIDEHGHLTWRAVEEGWRIERSSIPTGMLGESIPGPWAVVPGNKDGVYQRAVAAVRDEQHWNRYARALADLLEYAREQAAADPQVWSDGWRNAHQQMVDKIEALFGGPGR